MVAISLWLSPHVRNGGGGERGRCHPNRVLGASTKESEVDLNGSQEFLSVVILVLIVNRRRNLQSEDS